MSPRKRKRGIPKGDSFSSPPGWGRDQRRVVVTVVCEGKTERGYLERVNDEAGQESRFVMHFDPHSQPGKGFKPSEAVERAIDVRRRIVRSGEEDDEAGNEEEGKEPDGENKAKEHVWVVFDRDEHCDIDEAMRNAYANGIEVAFSTPSFDLWLLLHFAPGPPPRVSGDNKLLVRKLNAVPHFERYGKSSGGRASDSKPKVLNDAQLTALWEERGRAVRLARQLVGRCSSERCTASAKKAEPGHDPTCDPLKRDTQTDFYRLLELLDVDGQAGAGPGRRRRG